MPNALVHFIIASFAINPEGYTRRGHVGSKIVQNISSNSDIDAGVGKLQLNLNSSSSEYTFDIDKGIGSIKLNNKSISDGQTGTGKNKIEIDGGIGSIDITTID